VSSLLTGGARVATLSLHPCLQSLDYDRPGPRIGLNWIGLLTFPYIFQIDALQIAVYQIFAKLYCNPDHRVKNLNCYIHTLIYILTSFSQTSYMCWTPRLWLASLLLPLWSEPFWRVLSGSSTRIQVRKYPCIFTSEHPWTHLTLVLIPCLTLISNERVMHHINFHIVKTSKETCLPVLLTAIY